MKTQKITTCLLFCFIAIIFSSFTSSSIIKPNDEEDAEEDILLQGNLGKINVKSFNYPFAVIKSTDLITVVYLSNLNNISVSITDEYGETVYGNTVNPVSGGQLLIDIFGWDTGNYTIHFSNSAGGHIWGNFEILDDI